MTVTTSTARVVHNGNGTTTQFAVPFRFLENAHVAVFLRDAIGGQALWAENTQFSLAGADDAAGGTLTVITSPIDYTPAAGEKLVVIRAVPITQETDYVENDPFPAETHEQSLDKLTMVNQEQTERLDRTFTIPETDASAGSFVLPGDTVRALNFLAFDALGNPIVAVGTTPTTTPVSAFMETLLAAADETSVRMTLGTAPIFDGDGNELIKFTGTPLAVNEFTIVNAATGKAPILQASGEADIGLQLRDSNGNEIIIGGSTVAAVNELTVSNAATGNAPSIGPTGDDANIGVVVSLKGTGQLSVTGLGGLDVAGPISRAGNVLAEEVLASGSIIPSDNAASLDITDLPAGYRKFKLLFDDLLPVAAAADLHVRTSADNGANFDFGVSDYRGGAFGAVSGSVALQVANASPAAFIRLNHTFTLTNGAGDECAGEITLRNPRDSGLLTRVTADVTYGRPTDDYRALGWGRRESAQDVDAFQVLFSTGNISTMSWTLIGVRAT